ncbi:hypothetical protein ACFQJ7_15925 [Halovenus rubra]|uniref:Uncharacterized protein n=2 Tax=Halovenus rubra TaxID=869890 RepID=A0ACC7E425_9EURY|nr:nucleoside triphosphate pyrophosphohydrolase [Halovenus rubra]
MSQEYDKLVRDKIPEIIEANDEDPTTYVADGEEYATRLGEKLTEEVTEYQKSGDIEELADILEVVHAIRENSGVSVDELQEIRDEKAEQRGRFEDGIVLERVNK